jgi:transcriptional regulator with XRE-family HTH domain
MRNKRSKQESLLIDLGQKIRSLRRKKGFSIETFSIRSGLSGGAIQKIETNHMIPTIASLMKIANALGEKVIIFADENDGKEKIIFIKKKKRLGFYSEMSNIFHQYITGQVEERLLEGGIFTAACGGESGPQMNSHPGEEIIFCLKGRIEFLTPLQKYILTAGDSIHFKSDLPHRWINVGKIQAQLIWIYTYRQTG